MLAATQSTDTTGLVGKLHSLNEPREWAELAGLVFEAAADDPGAAMLVERSADALAALVELVREKLSLDGPVVLAGGLLLNQPRLEAEVRRRLGGAIRLEEPPVAGAVRLAELSLSSRSNE
jgi:N-acetylglucosamine kinase-like BadF-type ATPase